MPLPDEGVKVANYAVPVIRQDKMSETLSNDLGPDALARKHFE